ncbi:ABC-2 type transporter [Parasponia andersonii]|uniref:ABC-2 type transporter n=1 Tax=Parasponia andersonii TaxID=3476 RepID=A0A2P5C6P6_PARAD|nr:ABC-2 type transporter [Parasponia andersonii]
MLVLDLAGLVELKGDELVRVICGGQRKRVTTGEMLFGQTGVLFMDEISTGLDSSTTSDGQIVCHGPCEHLLDFFESMGFECPERKGVADFLQEITLKKDQEQYWARRDEPHRFVTVKESVKAFQYFHVGRGIEDELSTPFDKSKNRPASLATKKYGVEKKKELLKAVFYRERLLIKRNHDFNIFETLQSKRWDFNNSSTENESPMTIDKLPVFYKQRDLNFYPAWAYALFTWILNIPIACLEVAIWVAVTYYLIGVDPSVASLFKQLLLLIFVNQMGSALFQATAATSRNIIIADTFGTFVLLMIFGLEGFLSSKDDIKSWWIVGYRSSPLVYYKNVILVNEFLSDEWSHVVSQWSFYFYFLC